MTQLQDFINSNLRIPTHMDALDSSNAIWDDGEWVSWQEINQQIDNQYFQKEDTMETINCCILIDYENVQNVDLSSIDHRTSVLKIFVGKSQNKIPFDLVEKVQRFGELGEWIKIEGAGPNALDFHIAYTLGLLSASEKDVAYIVVSKDTGFDPLIGFMNANGLKCCRVDGFENNSEKILAKKSVQAVATENKNQDKALYVIQKLKVMPKPRSEKTLKNAIKSMFQNQLNESDIGKLYVEMKKRKLVIESQGKLQYPGIS